MVILCLFLKYFGAKDQAQLQAIKLVCDVFGRSLVSQTSGVHMSGFYSAVIIQQVQKLVIYCMLFAVLEVISNRAFKSSPNREGLRKHAWHYVKLIALDINIVSFIVYVYRLTQIIFLTYFLYQIRMDRRFEGAPENAVCFVSLDGSDFSINEQTPFNPKWYSHKLNGPGVRYEVGLNIRTGNMVWAFHVVNIPT